MSNKIYKSNLYAVTFSLILVCMAIYNLIAMDSVYPIIRIFAFCGVVYFALSITSSKIIAEDLTLKIEGNKLLVKPKSLDIKEINSISHEKHFGIHIYHLSPYDSTKHKITVTNAITNYKELLNYIVDNGKNIKLDEYTTKIVRG